jgi:copper chaperone CopZ
MKEDDIMQTKTVTVPNISCGHCKMRIEKTLGGVTGITSANADVDTKAFTVEWDETQVEWDQIHSALEKIGYPPAA